MIVRRRRLLIALAAVVVLGAGVAAFVLVRGGVPSREARTYLRAWSRSDFTAMQAMVAEPPGTFVSDHEATAEALRVTRADFSLGPVRRRGVSAQATFTVTWSLQGLGDWRHEGRLDLRRRSRRWLVAWSPATLHPRLQPGQRLGRNRTRPERGPILGAGDQVLAGPGEVVTVGLEPRRIRDRAEVLGALRDHAGVEPGRVEAALNRPGLRPDVLVPVVDLRPERYDQLRPLLAPVPGVVFRRATARLTPAEGFALHVLGRTGEATAERLAELGPLYQAGDVVGLSGAEGAFERELAGAPSGEVRVLDGAGATVAVLHRVTGSPGVAVRTTLDTATQTAAERALEGVARPAAIVAVDASGGEVRAVASRPLGEPFNRALAGRYPPGSTFKVVTIALLASGLTVESRVACPEEVAAGGKRFRNFEAQAPGDISFRQAFVQSCNTAFVAQATTVGRDALGLAATRFGFGADYDVGLRTAGGRFPAPVDAAETAAAGIGQGRVEASPVHMASVAAAVAGGAWRPPRLLPARATGPEARPLEPAVAARLRELMVAVVGEGTGTAAAVPGRTVGGKTGTAEFGPGTPPPTHAWFIGHHQTLGFAVLMEGGGVGGRVAAPLAARFVSSLGSS